MKIPELLAPAGSLESIQAACDHGADAVYTGIGPHNLRARCDNFSIDEFRDAVAYVRSCGVRIYVAVNTMPDDDGLARIDCLLSLLAKASEFPDAFIISDPGVLTICKKHCSNVPLHLSTQTGTFNSASALFWKSQGVNRIILPREMSLEEIASFVKKTGMETEVFVHGAMCVSISGRCLLGAYLGKRHPNRGDCPQTCRLEYRIAPCEGKIESDQWLTVEEESGKTADENKAYILNSKDLNTVSILPQIVSTGVKSLKIEGRNKSSHYVASVVKVYREALDAYSKDPGNYSVRSEWIDILNSLEHRTYTTGFYTGEYFMQETGSSREASNARMVGTVKAVTDNGEAIIDVKNPFGVLETLNVLPVRRNRIPFELHPVLLTDIDRNPIDRAITNRVVMLTAKETLRVGDMLRREEKP
jgi:U32 family peptidase